MKKPLWILLLAIHSTSAFAATQVLECRGLEADEIGELQAKVSFSMKIVRPNARSLLVINGESAASERAWMKINSVVPQMYGINVTNGRKAIAFSSYVANQFMMTAYIPLASIGEAGNVPVELSRTDKNNVTTRARLNCASTIVNSL